MGDLAVSRSLGDAPCKFNIKKSLIHLLLNEGLPYVTCMPDIHKIDLFEGEVPSAPSEKDASLEPTEFLVLACDGVWDVLSDQVRTVW